MTTRKRNIGDPLARARELGTVGGRRNDDGGSRPLQGPTPPPSQTRAIGTAGNLDVQQSGNLDVQQSGSLDVQQSGNLDVQQSGSLDVQQSGNLDVQQSDSLDVQQSDSLDVQPSGYRGVPQSERQDALDTERSGEQHRGGADAHPPGAPGGRQFGNAAVPMSRSPALQRSGRSSSWRALPRKQQTVYLPADLARWLKLYAVTSGQEISQVVTVALEQYRAHQETRT
jgi:hypothetical protein